MMPRRTGFTVIEILIGIIILAIMSAAVIPAVMGRIRDAQTSALSQTLFSLSLAIFEYKKAVTAYPDSLPVLATKPTNANRDACGALLTASNANNWRGPYISRELVSGGVGIGDARISSDLRHEVGPPTLLFIDVGAVEQQSVLDIEVQFDGPIVGNSATTGTIRYTTGAIGSFPSAPAGTYNLSYSMPINGC